MIFYFLMFHLTYNEIVLRIKEEKQLSDEEIEQRVKGKLKQLSDLISKEGAAHIVANELGVKILETAKEVKVDRLLIGMNNVSLLGKVVKINDVVSYQKNGRSGKVVSLALGDETGIVRVVFWDANHIQDIESGKISEGSILKINGGYVRANNQYKELHLGNKGSFEINPQGIEVEVKNHYQTSDYTKKKIFELAVGDSYIGVFGTIVQVFEPRFYDACKQCGKKVEVLGDSYQCAVHGLVNVEAVPILNLFFDDGTGSIRAVAFRGLVEELLNADKEKVLELRNNLEKFEAYRENVLGKQLVLVGRITQNEMFDRKEMSIQKVVEVQPEEIIKELEAQ